MQWLAFASYLLRRLAVVGHNLWCRLGRGPDFVVLRLSGSYPQFAKPRGWWQRRLWPPWTTLAGLDADLSTLAAQPHLRGLVLDLRHLDLPMAHLETLRQGLIQFKRSGKSIVAYASQYDTGTYFLATVADEVLLAPGGLIAPLGLRRAYTFVADLLARAGLLVDVIPISAYKTALDPLAKRAMSPEFEAMANWLMDAAYGELLRAVAEGRHGDTATARKLIDGSPYTDRRALEVGAVDGVVGAEDLPVHLANKGAPARLAEWPTAKRRLVRPGPARPGRHVALLRIEGLIVDGESATPPANPQLPLPLLMDPRAGDLTLVPMIRRLRRERRVAAVVVYIESRGGSATASEAIASALDRLAAEKPVVALLGPIAASGGYYVATPAQQIIAQPDTITGSIGVLTGKLVAGEALRRLRAWRQVLTRGQHIDLWADDDPFDEQERALISEWLDRMYELFVDRVAKSRGLAPAAVDAIGRGRVWTGRQAVGHRLLDELGGLGVALDAARQAAGLRADAPYQEMPWLRGPVAPFVQPGQAFDYALESLRLLASSRVHYLCPLVGEGEP